MASLGQQRSLRDLSSIRAYSHFVDLGAIGIFTQKRFGRHEPPRPTQLTLELRERCEIINLSLVADFVVSRVTHLGPSIKGKDIVVTSCDAQWDLSIGSKIED